MSITFESVSFSYSAVTKRNEKKRAKQQSDKKLKRTNHAEKPEWGNDPDAVWAIRDISFSLQNGEFFGIAGHTGSGKSTLIQHMNGLVHPTRGRVLVDGLDISDKTVATKTRAKVGLVFQYPEHQLFAATVYEDIAFGPRNMGLSEDEVDIRIHKALEQVSLDFDAVAQRSPFELSGGQQRRVAFAGVLAMQPSTLLFDEPVAGLDPAARIDFLDFIASLHKQGLTVVMVSHSMNDLARLCDRLLVLKEGETFMMGTPEEIFTQGEELKAIGLSAPSAQRLADSLKEEGVALGNTLYDAEKLADELATLYHQSSTGTQD